MTVKDSLRAAAEDALYVQDAVNLSGILRAWADAQAVLRDVCGGNANEAYLKHPINVLFFSKVASLLGMSADSIGGVRHNDKDVYSDSYEWCKKTAANE